MSSSATDCPHSFAYNSREKRIKGNCSLFLTDAHYVQKAGLAVGLTVKMKRCLENQFRLKTILLFLKDNNNSYVSFSSTQNASKFRAALLGAWPF